MNSSAYGGPLVVLAIVALLALVLVYCATAVTLPVIRLERGIPCMPEWMWLHRALVPFVVWLSTPLARPITMEAWLALSGFTTALSVAIVLAFLSVVYDLGITYGRSIAGRVLLISSVWGTTGALIVLIVATAAY